MNLNFPSLQHVALNSYIAYQHLHVLPPENHSAILFSHLKTIWENHQLDYLRAQYCEFKLFTILLNEKYRSTLLKSFCSVNILRGKPTVTDILLQSYKESNAIKSDIELGLKFAQFFIELGAHNSAIQFLSVVKKTCKATNNQKLLLECYGQLIYAFSYQYSFKQALIMNQLVTSIFDKLSPLPNCANLFSNISFMHFMLGDYYQALANANLAIKELNNQLPVKVVIKVLRLAARVFTVNRDLRQARLLIQHALTLSNHFFISDPYIIAEVYIDFGYYLSEINYIGASIQVYRKAMNIYKNFYRQPNLYHVIAERDMVFSLLKVAPVQKFIENKIPIWYISAYRHIARAAIDIIRLGNENHEMHQNAICEARALILEMYGLYGTSVLHERNESLTIAKKCYELSLRNHRKYFDKPRNEPSIKTVDCLVSIGRVCQHLNDLSGAEIAFKEAEAITINLKCRSNAEYFNVKVHRATLYRTNTEFFKRKGSILKAIKTMEQCRALLIRFEGYECECLNKFYNELIELYKLSNDGTSKVIHYEKELLDWRKYTALTFKALANYLPKTEPMKTIVDKIRKMNTENQKKRFDYAIRLNNIQRLN